MTPKNWTLFGLDLVVMCAVVLMVFDACVGDVMRLVPWSVSSVVAAVAGFLAIGVRDFWTERRPTRSMRIFARFRRAAPTQSTESGKVPA